MEMPFEFVVALFQLLLLKPTDFLVLAFGNGVTGRISCQLI